jgi:hypothetical protein
MDSDLHQGIVTLCKSVVALRDELAGSGLDPARQRLCDRLANLAERIMYLLSQEITTKIPVPPKGS